MITIKPTTQMVMLISAKEVLNGAIPVLKFRRGHAPVLLHATTNTNYSSNPQQGVWIGLNAAGIDILAVGKIQFNGHKTTQIDRFGVNLSIDALELLPNESLHICTVTQENNRSKQVIFTKGPCAEPFSWKVTKAVVHNNRFYLFGPAGVFNFPYSAWTKPNSKYSLTRMSYEEFLICEQRPNWNSSDLVTPNGEHTTQIGRYCLL